MKKTLTTLTLLLFLAMQATAMSYSKAREQALFLADKMAYELGLSDDQYNAVYEINLDYFMCVDSQDDVLGAYWSRRNTDLGYVLTVAQYALYKAASYFYKPIEYSAGSLVYAIYQKYTKKRYYNEAPAVYETYQGGNRFYTESPYKGRSYGGEAKKSSASNANNAQPKQDSQDNKQASSTSRGSASNNNRTSANGSNPNATSTSKKGGQDTQSGSMSRSQAVSKGRENTTGNNSGGRR